jgi:hypothetical protein
MSYVVTIRRADGSPISADAFRALALSDPSFRAAGPADAASALMVEWTPPSGDRRYPFSLSGGEISVATPSDEALRKMQEIARHFDAVVVGEDGEDLGDPAMPAEAGPGCTTPILMIVSLAALIALYWATR